MSRRQQLKRLLSRVPGLRASVRTARTLLNPDARSVWRLRKERPDNLFQPFADTFPDRYPRIFSFVKNALADVAEPRILSFGCSKGDEIFTLRRYFPRAALTGIDINPRNIRICRRRLRRDGDGNIRFVQAGDAESEAIGRYDAIFCMAVFRHGELGVIDAPTCGHLIRFEDFERTLEGLGRQLKPGGYLCLVHSNFRFRDTTLAAHYDPVFTKKLKPSPLYDRDNRRLPGVAVHDVVFRKRTPSSPERDLPR